MDRQPHAKQDAPDTADPAPLPNSLPPRPPKPIHTPDDHDDHGRASPPRKRPRTQAIRRAMPTPAPAPAPAPPSVSAHNPAPPSSTSSSSSRFSIQPLSRFHGASARIKRPREVAHFSYDDSHTYRPDTSSITYYHPPTLGSDLKLGFSSFHHYEDTSDPHLDSLLRAVADAERTAGEKIQADVVTWRGMMTKLMTAPFDAFAEFEMRATVVDGCVYLEEDFEAKARSREREKERGPPKWQDPKLPDHSMMTYWGYKFETLAMLPVPPGEASREALDRRGETRVSNHAQHCSIVKTSFGPHTLLLGGEVDGLSAPKPPPGSDTPTPWVELKTAEELPSRPSHRDILKFERKLLKFWAQSFLLGVPKVIVGWRSKMGILTGVQELETGQIPGMVRRGTGCWDGNVCINFATEVVGWLRGMVREEGKVYRVRLGKKAGVVEGEVLEEGDGGIVSREWREWRGELAGRENGDGEGEKEQDQDQEKEEKEKVGSEA